MIALLRSEGVAAAGATDMRNGSMDSQHWCKTQLAEDPFLASFLCFVAKRVIG